MKEQQSNMPQGWYQSKASSKNFKTDKRLKPCSFALLACEGIHLLGWLNL
jgi:hypothetical protein